MKNASVAVAIWALLQTAAFAADVKIDNPVYASWAKSKVGTVVTMTETMTFFDGKTVVYTHTYTLKELNADGARVEHKQFYEGKEATDFTVTYPEPKQKTLPDGSTNEDALKPRPSAAAAGDDKVKIGAKEYAAKKFTTAEKIPGDYTVTTTYWYSDAVPGLLLRMDTEKTANKGTFKETGSRVFTEVKEP